MIKIETAKIVYTDDHESWTWYINDIIIHETKDKDQSYFFKSQVIKLLESPITNIQIQEIAKTKAFILRLNNIPITSQIGEPGRTLRIGKRLEWLLKLKLESV